MTGILSHRMGVTKLVGVYTYVIMYARVLAVEVVEGGGMSPSKYFREFCAISNSTTFVVVVPHSE